MPQYTPARSRRAHRRPWSLVSIRAQRLGTHPTRRCPHRPVDHSILAILGFIDNIRVLRQRRPRWYLLRRRKLMRKLQLL